jgi:hypothetical protein
MRRSSEYPFALSVAKALTNPFIVKPFGCRFRANGSLLRPVGG